MAFSSGDYHIGINKDTTTTPDPPYAFRVAWGSGTHFAVSFDENGLIQLHYDTGAIQRGSPIALDFHPTSSGDDIVLFKVANHPTGTVKLAAVHSSGCGDFGDISPNFGGGVVIPTLSDSSGPDGHRSGYRGEIILWENTSSGVWYVCVNTSATAGTATTNWKKAALTLPP